MSGTLLIVDDEEDVLGVLTEYLSSLGYTVVDAASGEAAVEALRGPTRFDVAIVDWTLPGLSGRSVIETARALQPNCRIVVTTGHGAEVVHEASLQHAGGSIVRKPFTMRTLSTRVAMLLDKQT